METYSHITAVIASHYERTENFNTSWTNWSRDMIRTKQGTLSQFDGFAEPAHREMYHSTIALLRSVQEVH